MIHWTASNSESVRACLKVHVKILYAGLFVVVRHVRGNHPVKLNDAKSLKIFQEHLLLLLMNELWTPYTADVIMHDLKWSNTTALP